MQLYAERGFMKSIYLREVNFHTPETDEEIDELQSFQNKQIAKSWVKRMIIAFVFIVIFVVFQMGARITIPHMFGEKDTVERLIRNSIYVFLGFNILSWLELMFEHRVVFDIEEAKIAKLQVKKKMIIEYNGVVPDKIRYLVCEENGAFVLDRVYVRGAISFSNIKEGQTIYVERLHGDGHYEYYYIA